MSINIGFWISEFLKEIEEQWNEIHPDVIIEILYKNVNENATELKDRRVDVSELFKLKNLITKTFCKTESIYYIYPLLQNFPSVD